MEQGFIHPQEISSPNFQKKKRPVFLTILCILGFVCCGTGFFYFAYMLYISIKVYSIDVSPFVPMYVQESQSILPVIAFSVCVVSELTSLLGLLLIFKLKRPGFILYLASETLSMFFLIGVCFVSSMFFFNSLNFMVVIIFAVVGDIAFVVLHSVNYKHLK